MNLRPLFLINVVGLLAAGWLLELPQLNAQETAPPVTIFVVRHAERESGATDSPLSAQGWDRARKLADILKSSEITRGFTSEFQRTQQTLAPLAERLGLVPTTITAGNTDSLLAELRRLPPGSRAIVASHSNLVHRIVGALAGSTLKQLSDSDYDRLYIITLTPLGASVALLHF